MQKKNDILRPAQREAVRKMHDGCILNGGVGSGKSRTSLFYFFSQYGGKREGTTYIYMNNPPDLYIITTAQKRDKMEWEEELILFGLTSQTTPPLYPNMTVTVDSWNNIQKYKTVKGGFFIFDEQRLVGSGAWVKAFYQIAKSNRWILLSATPGDKWVDYIPVFVANGFYKNKTQFNSEHIIFNRFTSYPSIKGYCNTRKLERLRDSLLVDIEVERETERHNIDIWCDYDRNTYKTVFKRRWDIYKDEPIQQASGLCYVLRRLVNTDSSRAAKVIGIVKEHPKSIIFYNFDYELDILRSLDYPKGTKIGEWNGHYHQDIPDSKRWVYLVQYTAGSEGWNCIKTDTIIFYSQNYSYKVLEQSRGRIDRLNTAFKDLYYYHLKSKAPIDIAITRAIKQKKKFTERNYIKWD